jgi:uncharacterized phage protein gp47/JayE
MTNKRTINEMYAELLNLAEVKANPELVDFIKSRIEVNSRKNANKKQTPTQKANEEIKTIILEQILDGSMTVSQITKELNKVDGYEEISLNKVNALVRQLKESGQIIRTEEKGVAYFSLA